ncbi:LOW QUALITY PROTEIN: filamin-A-like [Ammospiza maritima maritima]
MTLDPPSIQPPIMETPPQFTPLIVGPPPQFILLDPPQFTPPAWRPPPQFIHNHSLHERECVSGCLWVLGCPFGSQPLPPPVQQPPELTEAPPEQLVVFPSDDAVLKCAASGSPAPQFRWTRDGRPFPSPSLSPAELAGVSVSPGGGTLVINASLAGRLQGRFRCEATNALGTAVSPESRVIAETPPQWPKEKVTPVTVEEGDPVVLPCEPPQSAVPPKIYWLNSRIVHIAQDARVSMGQDGFLYFANAQVGDSHPDYICHAHYLGPRTIIQKEPLDLRVTPSNSVQSRPPRLVVPRDPQPTHVALRGETLVLECIAEGLPTPWVWWRRLNAPLPPGRAVLDNFNHTLRLLNVSEADDGDYECGATNGLGTDRRSHRVTVQAAPYWLRRPQSGVFGPGETARLDCQVGGKPRPRVSWSLNGVPFDDVPDSDRLSLRDGALILSRLEPNDSMVAQCEASNVHGRLLANAFIYVVELPVQILTPDSELYTWWRTRRRSCTAAPSGPPRPPWSVLPLFDFGFAPVRAFGPGLQGGLAGVPAPFTIDTKGAGTGGLGLTVEGPCEAKIECQDNGDGTCSVSYLPTEPGDYNINILFAGAHIPGSPFRAPIRPKFDPSKVTCEGPGLEKATAGQPGRFRVDCSRAGTAELTIGIASEAGRAADVRVEENGDGIYTIAYTPRSAGVHTVTVEYGGQPVPHFPSTVRVEPAPAAVDTSGIKVYGPGVEGKAVFREAVTEFEVDARAVSKAGGPLVKALVSNPSGNVTETFVEDRGDGTYHVEYTPYEEGLHKVDVTYGGSPVPLSPFRVPVTEGCDPTRVRVHGPGIQSGTTNQPNKFTVETRGAGTGGLGLAVEGPSEAKMSCTDNKDGSCSVEYIPYEPGTYSLNVTYGGHQVPGSPFQVPVSDVVDASRVTCGGPGLTPGHVRANVPQTFTVDTSKAGVAPLDIKVQGPKGVLEPVDVADNGDGTQRVSYVPSREGTYNISVRYGDQEVPRSPFKVKALPTHDASKVRASGPGLNTTGVPASLPVEFTIDAKDAGEGLLAVQITDPEGKPKKASIRDNQDGTYTVSYVPDMTGRYTILIKYGGDEIPYSPYRIRAVPTGDASKCTVTVSIGGHGLGPGLGPTIQLGEQTLITVDAKAAGKGKVTCSVCTPDGSEVDVDVVENPDGTFDIFYTAPQPGKYVICVRFGGEHIPNSPFQVMATDRPLLGVNGLDMAGLRPFDLVIPFTIKKGEITGEVRMPSGKVATPDITDNKDGTVTVRFAPSEAGLHEMDIRCDSIHIPGSPLQFYVDYVNSGHVTAYGPGLTHGTVNRPATFTVNTKDAGEGGLSLAVEGPSKAEISCQDNGDGTCSVSYLPVLPGDYGIVVKYNDKHIAGSPFTARITGDDSLRQSHLKVGASAEIPLDMGDIGDLSQLSATVTAPSGRREPCTLKRLRDGHLGISFVPQEVGEHLVHVTRGGQPLPRSPLAVTISQAELGDASRVLLRGPGLSEGTTFQPAQFTIDTRQAGYGGLSLSIEGPSKVDITTEELEDGTCRVSYCPTEPGNYIISVKFGEQHVPGSPFSVKVTGEGRVRESITRRRRAPPEASVGTPCDLSLKMPELSVSDVTAQVAELSVSDVTAQVAGSDPRLRGSGIVSPEGGRGSPRVPCGPPGGGLGRHPLLVRRPGGAAAGGAAAARGAAPPPHGRPPGLRELLRGPSGALTLLPPDRDGRPRRSFSELYALSLEQGRGSGGDPGPGDPPGDIGDSDSDSGGGDSDGGGPGGLLLTLDEERTPFPPGPPSPKNTNGAAPSPSPTLADPTPDLLLPHHSPAPAGDTGPPPAPGAPVAPPGPSLRQSLGRLLSGSGDPQDEEWDLIGHLATACSGVLEAIARGEPEPGRAEDESQRLAEKVAQLEAALKRLQEDSGTPPPPTFAPLKPPPPPQLTVKLKL